MLNLLHLDLIVTLERLFRAGNPIVVNDEFIDSVKRLINLYNSTFEGLKTRKRAAKLVAGSAQNSSTILKLVFDDARKYAREQHIDDASPHSPNSFEVLALVGPVISFSVVLFLEDVIKEDWGIPRWAAIEALCKLNNEAADKVLKKIILGCYPPQNFDNKDDLRVIEKYKGNAFVATTVFHNLD